jgi:hypothetical protein
MTGGKYREVYWREKFKGDMEGVAIWTSLFLIVHLKHILYGI